MNRHFNLCGIGRIDTLPRFGEFFEFFPDISFGDRGFEEKKSESVGLAQNRERCSGCVSRFWRHRVNGREIEFDYDLRRTSVVLLSEERRLTSVYLMKSEEGREEE